jgi:hypothetical protein
MSKSMEPMYLFGVESTDVFVPLAHHSFLRFFLFSLGMALR